MTNQDTKCVIVINEELPLGIIANTCTILGITLGKHVPELVGEDAVDSSEKSHLGIITIPVPILMGIITIPVPILKANKELLRALREELYTDNYKDVITVDFSDVAQSCNVYSEYLQKASMTPELEHSYFGLAICGHKKKVNKLTGSMPLLR